MFKKGFLIVFLLGLFGSFVNAQVDPMNLPKLTQYVSDFSNVLDVNSLAKLNTTAELYDKQTTNQIVAVLIPNRNGNELFDIGMHIFNTNTIGQAGKNNGLLLLISTEEKKIRIIVGYGLEGEIPDLLASRIIEEDIRPLVDSGDFAGAIQKYYERISSALDTGEGAQYQSTTSNDQNNSFWIIGLILGFVLAIFLKPKFKKSWKKYIIFGLLLLLVALTLWLSAIILVGVLAGLFFGFTGIMPGRGGFGAGGGFGGGGFSGGFGGGGGSSGGGGAGD